jgi:hypothetical protein
MFAWLIRSSINVDSLSKMADDDCLSFSSGILQVQCPQRSASPGLCYTFVHRDAKFLARETSEEIMIE